MMNSKSKILNLIGENKKATEKDMSEIIVIVDNFISDIDVHLNKLGGDRKAIISVIKNRITKGLE